MALTKISRGLLNTGVSDSSDANAITISSAEKVTVTNTLNAPTSIQTPLIEFTDGDDAIAIADGGAVTMAKVGAIGATTAGTGAFTTLTTSSNLTVGGNLTVTGTSTVVDTVTMNAQNAVIFEGATADNYETTLSIVDPTADHTQYLINQGGYVPVLAAVTTTAITSTPAELNLLDTAVANTVVNGKAVIYGGSGELAGTLSTAAQGNITSVGTLTALQIDDINIDGSQISDQGALTIAGETLTFRTDASDWGTAITIDDAQKIAIGNNIPMWSGSYGGALFLKGNNATADRHAELTTVDSNGATTGTGLVVKGAGALIAVGIGTASPGDRLDVLGSTTTLDIGTDDTAAVVAAFVPDVANNRNGRLRIAGTTSPHNNSIALISDSSTNVGMAFVTTGSGTKGERMVIDSTGNVGIGTVSPAQKLHVYGVGVSSNIALFESVVAHASRSPGHPIISQEPRGSSDRTHPLTERQQQIIHA